MEKEIKTLIEKNYKNATVEAIEVHGDLVVMKCTTGRSGVHPLIALRILNRYPKIRAVHFTGGWIEGYYSRETLKWGGYKVKDKSRTNETV